MKRIEITESTILETNTMTTNCIVNRRENYFSSVFTLYLDLLKSSFIFDLLGYISSDPVKYCE